MAKEINIYLKISIPSFEDQVPHTTLKFILPHTHLTMVSDLPQKYQEK